MFSTKFNKYLKERKCSARKFSAMTDISEPTISRYKTGKTVPSLESGNIEKIAKALSELPGSTSSREEIYEDLLVAAYEDMELVDYRVFSRKLSSLIDCLDVNQSKLADSIPISSSHLSKICHEQTKPRNPVWIAESVARYISYNYTEESHYTIIQKLIWGNEAEKHQFSSAEECARQLKKWLLIGESFKSMMVNDLLYQHGEYDITNYLPYSKAANAMDLDDNIHANSSQLFTGMKGLKKAFKTWVDIACNSKINDDIFVFDEILAEYAEKDPVATYDYANSFERIIRNGKQLTVVNNLHDDLYLAANRMLLWLPLTMSRRVDNYFMNEPREKLYKNMIMISSDAVLIGNVIDDDYDNGYYTLIHSAADILIARSRASCILGRAQQSNYVFNNRQDFENDLIKHLTQLEPGDHLNLFLPSPPLATMSEDLLRRILSRNNVSSEMTTHLIERYYKEYHIRNTLSQQQIIDVTLNYIDYSDWNKKPVYVAFNDRSTELTLEYTYEEYAEHIELTKEFTKQHKNINLKIEHMNFYENMLVVFIPGKYGAVTTQRGLPVDTSSEKKIIVDSFQELIDVTTPSNYSEVMKDENKSELLLFIKEFMNQQL